MRSEKEFLKKLTKIIFFLSESKFWSTIINGPISGIVFHMRCPEPYRTKLPQKRREQVTNLYQSALHYKKKYFSTFTYL